jgi:hypothetical protein
MSPWTAFLIGYAAGISAALVLALFQGADDDRR